MKRIIASLIVCFCVQLSVTAQYNFADVDASLQRYQKELGNDFAALVVKDGKIIYEKKMGDFDKKGQAPVGSASQWMTAAVVMQFVDEGKISLDSKVSDYLPIFAKYSKRFITIRHCLSHYTGIESKANINAVYQDNYETLEEEVNDFASKKDIETNPGTEFKYSNIGPDIAARVIEVITKRGFDQIARQRLFQPLEMRNTSYSEDKGAINPSGGLKSSASDYINFLSMILNKGMFKGKRILSEASIAEMEKAMTTPEQIKWAPDGTEGFTYTLGTWIQETDAAGNATVIGTPGLFGTWPYIDKCRKYACIFITKTLLKNSKRKIYENLKKDIDAAIGNCQ